MAYQTGTFSDLNNLKSIVETFHTANGWTLSGNVLHRGNIYVRMAYEATWKNLEFYLGDGIDGSNNLTNEVYYARILNKHDNITIGNPSTYHFFMSTDQNSFFCIINHATSYIKHFCWGELVKYGSWNGGQYYSAPNHTNVNANQDTNAYNIFNMGPDDKATVECTFACCPFIPVNENLGAGFSLLKTDLLAGKTYLSSGWSFNGGANNSNDTVGAHLFTSWISRNAGNAWNSQIAMVPYYLTVMRGVGSMSIMGHIDQIRSIRVDNLEIGDIITIGSDQWMTFPWYKKSFTNPHGNGNNSSVGPISGLHGYAIRYQP